MPIQRFGATDGGLNIYKDECHGTHGRPRAARCRSVRGREMVYIVEVPLRAALMPISKMPWAELNRRGHNRPEPFLRWHTQPHTIFFEHRTGGARPTNFSSDTTRSTDTQASKRDDTHTLPTSDLLRDRAPEVPTVPSLLPPSVPSGFSRCCTRNKLSSSFATVSARALLRSSHLSLFAVMRVSLK